MNVNTAAIALSRSELRYLFEHGNLFWDIPTLVTAERSLIVAMVDLDPEDLNAEARLVKQGVEFSEPITKTEKDLLDFSYTITVKGSKDNLDFSEIIPLLGE